MDANDNHVNVDPLEKKKNKAFECCKTKTVSVSVCVKCGKAFHRSCLERKEYQTIDETRIICCYERNTDQDNIKGYLVLDGTDENSNAESKVLDINLNREFELLNKIILEKEEKFAILMENKKLLEYKVNNLLNEIKKYTSAENTNAYKNSVQAKTTVSKERTSTTKKDQQNIKANRDSSENKQINNDESQEIPDYPSHNENMNTDDFEKVQTRKQKRNQRPPPNKTIGQGEETNTHGFKGAVPKAWMYVYRVLPEVETNHIKSYLKEKLGEDEEYDLFVASCFELEVLECGALSNKNFKVHPAP
ncbi:hypothetical protein JTB14_029499 [Gonioctena quinquepunctata]|nr:hypothetical protein JTB14_029499 [Gonioctena quinquepunctata]